MHHIVRALGLLLAVAFVAPVLRATDWTWTYAVEISATTETSPARVTLHWPADEIPATRYAVSRKAVGANAWGDSVSLDGPATSYVDENVSPGSVYEYQVQKFTASYSAYGYIAVGLDAPAAESRGKIVLVVDRSIADAIAGEIRQLELDLVGDGWGVLRHDVGRDDPPAGVRATIQSEYAQDPANVKAVFLLGHVPIVRAGNLNVDGHVARPMPADVYYGEMDGAWTDNDGDGVLDQSRLPSDVELEVGRVDFADLPGAYVGNSFPSEIDLLRRYLGKDHAFRHALVRPPARALVGNVIGDERGEAFAASGYRNFAALVGSDHIDNAGTDETTPPGQRWISMLASNDYLWAYGCGAGSDISLGGLGFHGDYDDVWGSDFIEQHARATFYMLFGSWIADWAQPDNLMRTALATPDYGLAAAWSGRPHLFFHHMGSGETIGYGIRVSQNNDGTLYRNQVQRLNRGIHIALLGDPTLTLAPVAPPHDLRANNNGGDVVLTWSSSADHIAGYRVYRADNAGAPFLRVSGEFLGDTRFVDHPGNAADAIYMVRAIARLSGPSGSYFALSEGAFNRDDFAPPAAAAPATDTPGAGIATAPNSSTGPKISGAAIEVASDIHHPNGNIYDQILLTGPSATVAADAGQVTRISFLDLNDDIVQVEFSGAGTLTVQLASASGPALPRNYNQDVTYMKGQASLSVAGANETTNLAVFSVGRANAVNASLFRGDVIYDGVADIALIMIASANGHFGSLRTGNAAYSATLGTVGIVAPDVQFDGPVIVGDLRAYDAAMPTLVVGSAATVQVAGGSLAQPNGRAIAMSGVGQLNFTDGATSQGIFLPAQIADISDGSHRPGAQNEPLP
ncbi:MAG TPA: fibronectin type III domain-containing protein [Opitutaceae bacterium]|nr:fibronectin type III domain-containing protein [Opitutaceae bacterium]